MTDDYWLPNPGARALAGSQLAAAGEQSGKAEVSAHIMRALEGHEALLTALREIAQAAAEAPASSDHRATNTIEAMRDLALDAIKEAMQ